MFKIGCYILFVFSVIWLSSQNDSSNLIMLTYKGSNRATYYLESNKIIENDKFIIATLLEQDQGFYNTIYKVRKEDKTITSYRFKDKVKDNHSGAAISVDNRGYIYVVVGGHSSSIETYISTEPWSIEQFEKLNTLDGKYTYPSIVFSKEGVPYLLLRETIFNGSWNLSLFSLNNRSWKLISKPVAGNYSKWLADDDNDLRHTKGYTNFSATIEFDKNDRLLLLHRVYEYVPKNFSMNELALNPFQKYGASYVIGYTFSDDYGKTWKTIKETEAQKEVNLKSKAIVGNVNAQKAKSYFEISNVSILSDTLPVFTYTERKKTGTDLFVTIIKNSNTKETKRIDLDEENMIFGRPRINVMGKKLYFVISALKEEDYNVKETWGGAKNFNLFGVFDLERLKLVHLVPINTITPSWTGTLPYGDLTEEIPILINNGKAGLKQSKVYLLFKKSVF